jgi:hypothetical protein
VSDTDFSARRYGRQLPVDQHPDDHDPRLRAVHRRGAAAGKPARRVDQPAGGTGQFACYRTGENPLIPPIPSPPLRDGARAEDGSTSPGTAPAQRTRIFRDAHAWA